MLVSIYLLTNTFIRSTYQLFLILIEFVISSNWLPKLYKPYKNSIWEKKLASNLFKVESLCLAYFITKAVDFYIPENHTDMKNVTY